MKIRFIINQDIYTLRLWFLKKNGLLITFTEKYIFSGSLKMLFYKIWKILFWDFTIGINDRLKACIKEICSFCCAPWLLQRNYRHSSPRPTDKIFLICYINFAKVHTIIKKSWFFKKIIPIWKEFNFFLWKLTLFGHENHIKMSYPFLEQPSSTNLMRLHWESELNFRFSGKKAYTPHKKIRLIYTQFLIWIGPTILQPSHIPKTCNSCSAIFPNLNSLTIPPSPYTTSDKAHSSAELSQHPVHCLTGTQKDPTLPPRFHKGDARRAITLLPPPHARAIIIVTGSGAKDESSQDALPRALIKPGTKVERSRILYIRTHAAAAKQRVRDEGNKTGAAAFS